MIRLTQYGYCPCGALEQLTDPAGNVTEWDHDLERRVIDKKINGQLVATYGYEPLSGRMQTLTDALNQAKTYTYWPDNDPKTITYAGALHTTPNVAFGYDAFYNRLTSVTDGAGLAYTYVPSGTDGAGQLLTAAVTLTNSAITYGYDQLGRRTSRSIDGANQLSWGYDALGRPQGETSNLLGAFTYTYLTNAMRPDYLDYPTAQRINFAYYGNTPASGQAGSGNEDRRLKEIINHGAGSGGSGPILSDFLHGFDVLGRMTSWTQTNSGATDGQLYALGYDNTDWLTSRSITDAVTGAAVNSASYTYDNAGNRTQKTINGAADLSTFNGFNQLTESNARATPVGGTVDKPSAVTVNGVAATMSTDHLSFTSPAALTAGSNTFTITATELNPPAGFNPQQSTKQYQLQIGSGPDTTYIYDLNGNLTHEQQGGADVRSYEWDAENRMTAINYPATNNDPTTAHRTEFTYDGMSRWESIVEKDSNGNPTSTKHFVWDGLTLAEERDGSNNVTKRFFDNGEQIQGTSYYYTRDHLGSIREMTDASGAVQVRYAYGVWGERTKLSGSANLDCDFGFTGHYTHSKLDSQGNETLSGLSLTIHRSYNPNTAKWLSRDPIGEDVGPNLYNYVANNPVAFIDPLGLDPLNFYNLWQNYPRPQMYPTTTNAPAGQTSIWNLIGGKVGENGNSGDFTNSCAIRMSYALNKSGDKIPFIKGKTVSGADGSWYFFRVSDLQNYLSRQLGPPLQFTPQNWQTGCSDKTGILEFQNNWSDATGHFDLYDGSSTVDGEDFSTEPSAQGVSLYPVK